VYGVRQLRKINNTEEKKRKRIKEKRDPAGKKARYGCYGRDKEHSQLDEDSKRDSGE